MSATSIGEGILHSRLRAASGRLFWLGLAMTILGVVALIFPSMSTLATTLFVGWMLLLSGALTLAGSFSIHGTGPFFGALLLGLLSIAAGIFLLLNPAAGAVALTMMIGVLFMIEGAFQMVLAFEIRPLSGWVGMLLSSLASIALALLIAAGWPQISGIMLGILLGVNFVSTGLGYVFVSRAMKPPA